MFKGRKAEYKELKDLINSDRAEYLHLRGRRRIGKSEILKKLSAENKQVFYFYGNLDEGSQALKSRFILEWESYTKSTDLSELKPVKITWKKIFEQLTKYARKKKLVLAFDEIQWIAKSGSGFLGELKNSWSEWKKIKTVKVILCGSSSRFFQYKTDNELAVLRGLKTHADIWIKDFSLKELKDEFFSNRDWSLEKVCLLYLLVGGVPYYLEQLGQEKNFFRAINQAFFTSGTIFLSEVDAVLNLEFNKKSLHNVKTILSSIKIRGTTQEQIVKQTGLAKQTVSDLVNKLLDFEILFQKKILANKSDNNANNQGQLYFLKDFYLNFYFNILQAKEHQIKSNYAQENLFTKIILQSPHVLYIPNYAGEIFELLVYRYLDERRDLKSKLSKALGLNTLDYLVGYYYAAQQAQVDIVVQSESDLEIRIIECKWVGSNYRFDRCVFNQLVSKKYPNPNQRYQLSYHLITNKAPTAGELKQAKKVGVNIIRLESLLFVD